MLKSLSEAFPISRPKVVMEPSHYLKEILLLEACSEVLMCASRYVRKIRTRTLGEIFELSTYTFIETAMYSYMERILLGCCLFWE